MPTLQEMGLNLGVIIQVGWVERSETQRWNSLLSFQPTAYGEAQMRRRQSTTPGVY
jgi:hypothetical protein